MKVKYSDLKNKRVFITGGSSGIGGSIVEHFCEQGSEVYFVDIDLKETKKLLNKIKKNKFRTPTFIECNLLDINKLEKIIKNIISKKGPINCLVNNAANDDRHTTDQVDEKYWENRMAINLKHYFFAAKEAEEEKLSQEQSIFDLIDDDTSHDQDNPSLFSEEQKPEDDQDNIHELEITQDQDDDVEVSAEEILDEEILEIPAFLRRQSK